MNSPLRFGFGNSPHSVNAALVFQFTVNAFAAYRKHHFLDAAEFGGVVFHFFGLPAVLFGEFNVHSVQFVGK